MRGGLGHSDKGRDCVTHGQAGTGDFRVLRRAATKGGENTTELGEGFLEDFVCLCQELLKAVDHKHTPVSLWGMAGGNRLEAGSQIGNLLQKCPGRGSGAQGGVAPAGLK